MQDLKTGHLLNASPKAQFFGQLIGSFFSVFFAVCSYQLYSHAYTIPGPEFPVPTARVFHKPFLKKNQFFCRSGLIWQN